MLNDTVIDYNSNKPNEGRLVCVGLSLLLLILDAKFLVDSTSPLYMVIQYFSYTYIGVGSFLLARDALSGFSLMDRMQQAAVLLLILLVAVAIMRSYIAGTLDSYEFIFLIYEYVVVMFFIIGAYCYLSRRNMIKEFIIASANCLFLYVAANIFLFALGASSQQPGTGQDYEAIMLSLIGIDIFRVQFPLSSGINAFGSISGVASVFSLMLWIATHKKRYILYLFLSLSGILMVDNRGGLFMIIVAVSITQLFWHRRKIAVLVPLAIPFVYILIAVILLSTELSNLTDTLSRSKSDAQTLGGRGIIWIQVLDELSNFKPIHLVGYGMYGQQTSELSYGYLKIFSDYLTDTPERMSVHSGYLQTLIDFGYIGLILIMILNSVMMWRIASASNDGYPKIMLCVLVSMLLIGILEPVPTIYSRELFYIYFMLVVAGFGLTGDNSKLKTSVQI